MNENILEEMKKLKLEIYKLKSYNWISSKGNGTGAAGKTLETLLGKKEDKDILPDYHGIEIKTKSLHSNYPVTLFSCAFDTAPHLMYKLLKIGGYKDKKDPSKKVFQTSVNGITWKRVGRHIYKLHVNYEKKLVELQILCEVNFLEVATMAWTFGELRSRLEHKMQYMMFVEVMRERADEKIFFKYKDPKFYKLKGFDEFLKLIENGTINVTFKISYDHSEEKYGQYLDRGTSFEIHAEDFDKLFEQLDV